MFLVCHCNVCLDVLHGISPWAPSLCRSQVLWGWLLPVFVLVPIIRVFFNYFPFIPNKWFGLGFPIYYLIATPLLYLGKVRTSPTLQIKGLGQALLVGEILLICNVCPAKSNQGVLLFASFEVKLHRCRDGPHLISSHGGTGQYQVTI
jgi:hypothetical protein